MMPLGLNFWLSLCRTRPKHFWVLAWMGGIFGEGVDLAGSRLIGCAIVGVGLPQVNPQQEMLRCYYDAQNGFGFDYAYRYPGMNKVPCRPQGA